MERYRILWNCKTPGFLVFLIDQSCLMSVRNKHLQVAKAIQDAIMECYSSCIAGEYIKPCFAMSIIGYGDEVKEIWSGWINDEKLGEKLFEANDNDTSFIPAKASGGVPMAQVFELAYTTIQKWFTEQNEQKAKELINALPAPIVINITGGLPDDESSATTAAHKIMELNGDDGNVLLFNLHISNDDKEYLFPMSETDLDGSKEVRFLFNISSKFDEDIIETAYYNGYEYARIGARGMITNASADLFMKFIPIKINY